MELDILTLSQQMKSSFMLACTFHMKKNIVRISFISTSNGNKPAKKGNSTPIFFYSTTSTNREKKFYLRKFFTRKMFFFSVFGIEMKNDKKKNRNVEWHKFNNNNNSALSGASQYTAYRARHRKKVWGDTHPLNTKSQISSWLFICTYVCTYLDMKNLIKFFFILLLIFGISLSLTVRKKQRMISAKW